MNWLDVPEKELKAHALRMWANFIETGDLTISATDAINSGQRNMLKSLDIFQMKLIIRLREMADA